MDLIFEISSPGRRAFMQAPIDQPEAHLPLDMLRQEKPCLPEVSELQAVRHYTLLSQMNFFD